MLRENKDFYVQSYIQTQNTGIAYETLSVLQLLKIGENGGQRTTAEGRNYSNAGLSPWPRPKQCDVILLRESKWQA